MKKFWIVFCCILAAAAGSFGIYYSKVHKNAAGKDFFAKPGDTFVELKWKKEKDASYYVVCRSSKEYPASVSDDTPIYVGKGLHLTGVEADRNLDNGSTYYYTLFALDASHHVKSTRTASATPTPMQHENFVKNPDFTHQLDFWKESQGSMIKVAKSKDPSIGYYVILSPERSSDTILSQKISGLKPKTLYTVTVETIASSLFSPATFQISGNIQRQQQLRNLTDKPEFGFGALTDSSIKKESLNRWQRKGFVFYTGSEESHSNKPFDGTVQLSLIAPKSKEPDTHVGFARVQLIEGIAPYYYPHAMIPSPGENLFLNPTFKGKPPKNWSIENAVILNERINPRTFVSSAKLNPTNRETALATQTSLFDLAPNQTYHFSCLAKVDPGKIAFVYLYDKYTQELLFSIEVSKELSDGAWHTLSHTFQTPSSVKVLPMLFFSAYKEQGNGWHASFAKPSLLAVGGESLPTSFPIPKIQLKQKTWTFDQEKLDSQDWLVLNQKGSYPENISFTQVPGNDGRAVDVLKFTGYGNEAEKQLKFHGASIMTREYFCSGRYDVFAKIGPVLERGGSLNTSFQHKGPLGCSFAIWPFSYIDYQGSNLPQVYDQPSPIRNTEIDIEIPADLPNGAGNFDFSNGRLNSWGGQRGGDGGNVELHKKMPKGINPIDGKFHQYTIVWHAGTEQEDGTRIPGFVRWYVDTGFDLEEENLWGEWRGSSYGFDNIPYRCARFYIGCWFPPGSYNSEGVWESGWAGEPNWYQTEFYLQKVTYTPYNKNMAPKYPLPNRDRYVPETNPTKYWHQAANRNEPES